MPPIKIALIWCGHLLALFLAVYTTRTSGVPVIILLYAFLIDYVMRLGTIRLLYGAPGIAAYVTRLPGRHQQSRPITEEGGRPFGIGGYLMVIVAFAFFAFVLANVNADRKLALTPQAGLRDLAWALVIAMLYWINSLMTRTIVIQPREPLTANFGYNSKEVTVLALAILTGAAVVVYRQNAGLPATAWTVMGPLLGYRFIFDLWSSLDAVTSDEERGAASG